MLTERNKMTETLITDIAKRLLNPQDKLSDELFDYAENLLPYAREELLNIALFFHKQIFEDFEDLKICDICLTGSMAGYTYHEKSDIDIRIIIQNKTSFLTKDAKRFEEFLSCLSGLYYHTGFKPYFNNRFVDIKMSSRQVDLLGNYSLLKNKWVVYPSQKYAKQISYQELIDAYENRRTKITKDIEDLRNKYNGCILAEKLDNYYYNQVSSNVKIKDYLVFKLLNYAQIIKPIGAESIRTYNESLSLKLKQD